MRAVRFVALAAGHCIAACTSAPSPDPLSLAQAEIDVYTAAYKAYNAFDPDSSSADTLFISAQFIGDEEVQNTVEYLRPDVGEGLARAYAEANRRSGWHAGPPATGRTNVVFAADSLLPRGMENHAPVL